MGQPRIAFVSREVYPFGGGGLGNYVTSSAGALAPHAEVTIITSSMHEASYRELAAARDPRLPAGVRFEFVREPAAEEIGGWYGHWHLWSARAFETLVRAYPGGGPDLAEFPDYLGEGCVAAQAAQTHDPRVRNTRVCVRFYTTAEMAWVLDGSRARSREARMLYDLERYALRYANLVISPADSVLETYHRFYGAREVAPATTIRHLLPAAGAPTGDVSRRGPAGSPDGALRMLYVGRLERRKGVQNLIRAVTALRHEQWSLTLVGDDTPTAPLGVSMRDQLELMADGDPRIDFLGAVDRGSVLELVRASDLVVSPSLWECWPNVVLEALQLDRPVLATPVGGHVEMVRPGESGWLAGETSAESIHELLEEVMTDRDAVASLAGGPRRRFERLADAESVVEGYLELCGGEPSGPRRSRAQGAAGPTVSVIVPYFRMEEYVEQALESVRAQTFRDIEVIVVNDGSLREEDRFVADLEEPGRVRVVAQPNSGLGQARNLGVRVSRGRYVLPLDPDNLLAPTFVERCVDVLESRPEIAYVTSWSRYIGEDGTPVAAGGGYQPLGNAASSIELENVAGDAIALIRRRYFDLGLSYSPDMTSYEDWLLYWQLRRRGQIGHVIPERLIDYRVRERSMLREVGEPRLELLLAELDARIVESEIEWKSSSG